MSVAIEKEVYCCLSDVLQEIKYSDDTVTAQFQARIERAIKVASGLIDDYCNTHFYEMDNTVSPIDGFDGDLFASEDLLFCPFPISRITEIRIGGIAVSSSDYSSRGMGIIRRRSGDWCDVDDIQVFGKFGYKNRISSDADYLERPEIIKNQCAVFVAYLLGERKYGNIKETSGWENRTTPNIPLVTITEAGGVTDAFAFVGAVNPTSTDVITYNGLMDVVKAKNDGTIIDNFLNDKPVQLGWQAPISQIEDSSIYGMISPYEFKKLDTLRFLRV